MLPGEGAVASQRSDTPWATRLLRLVGARRMRAFVLAVFATLAFLILPGWITWRYYEASAELSTQEVRLQRLIGTIVHLDEVLTMSARMAAATGDPRWERRYRKAEPQLDAAIEQAIQLSAGAYAAAAELTAAANRALIRLENRAFVLANSDRRDEAQKILFSPEYERSKRTYAEGMTILTTAIDARIQREVELSERQFIEAGALTFISASALVLAWIGVVALIWRHLSARTRAEKEREYLEAQIQYMQKLESLGVLAGGIAHDFNNLLMPILGNADLILSGLPPDSPDRTKLERLRDAGQRLTTLTGQLLAYSGKGTFVVRPVDLSGLVREMAQLVEMSISKRAVVRFELAEDLPPVEADASQLGQIVLNLVTNASEAIDDEEGWIVVRTGLMHADRAYLADSHVFGESSEGSYVYLEVEDSGSGMDTETQQRVFDPFFTTKFAGRGLGLAVILGIVRGHEGGIRLRSELRRGTSFRVFFACGERPVQPTPEKAAFQGEWRGEGGVLVVDDDTDVRDLAGIMLRRLGFTVYTAADGREGVAAFREHAREIDVVLLDLTMPGMSGGEACREIQRIEPNQRIVLMSGYNEEFAASRAVDRMAGFLQKPFTQEDLGGTLRALLEKTSRG